jgi:DNA repair exonuclease SbcCD ATPase subunit
MIVFKKISWRNFLSTGDKPTIVFFDRSSTTLIIGENGSGKSTILDALTFGLFGKPFRNINKPQLVNAINEKELMVEIDFSIGKKDFTVRRGVKPNVFEIFQNGKMFDQTANVRDYQDYLERVILKLNYKSFTQIVLLGNSSFEPFMQLKQSDRRAIVEDLLDIQIFSSMNMILKQKNSELKGEFQQNENQRKLNESQTKMQQEYIERLKQDNESIIFDKTQDIKSFKKQKKYGVDTLNVLQEQILALGDKMLLEDEIQKKTSEFGTLQNKIDVRLDQEQKELKFYQTNSTCSQCKQNIDDVFKKERIIDISKGIDEKKDGLDKIVSEIDTLEQQLEGFKSIGRKIAEKNKNLAGIESKIQSIDSNIERTQKEIEKLQEKKELDSVEENTLQSLQEDLRTLEGQYQGLCETKQTYEYANELLRDTGIKTKIIRQYVPIINKYVNKYLNELDFLINFTIDENFNETIQSQYRDEFSYSSFSEGEKMRIDLALLFTWRMVAKLKNSVNTNLLILDEVFDSSLDAEGTEAFLKIINTLDADTNVFVISHKGEILFDKFLSTIKFVKEKQFSKIEML